MPEQDVQNLINQIQNNNNSVAGANPELNVGGGVLNMGNNFGGGLPSIGSNSPLSVGGQLSAGQNIESPTALPFQSSSPNTQPQTSGNGAGQQNNGANLYTSGMADDASDLNDQTFTKMLGNFQTKVEGNNVLQTAKQGLIKGLYKYNPPLTADEQKALTPTMQHALMTGNTNLISTIVSDLDSQIQGYNKGIDTSITSAVTALDNQNKSNQDMGNMVADLAKSGVDAATTASIIKGASGGTIDPSQYGLQQTGGGILNSYQTGTVGGQCGAFVNSILGGGTDDGTFGDTIQQKESMINSQNPQAGEVAIIPTSGVSASEGHVAVVESVNSNGTLNVIDSNWGLDGKVQRHTIPASMVKGYYNPPNPIDMAQPTWSYMGQSSTSNAAQAAATAIDNNQATIKDYQVSERGAITAILDAEPHLTFNQQQKISSQFNGYPKLIQKATPGGIFGGGTPEIWEYKDASGGIQQASDATTATSLQDQARTQALQNASSNMSSTAGTTGSGGQTVSVGGQQLTVGQSYPDPNNPNISYTPQADGTLEGSDGNTYTIDSSGNIVQQ